MNAVLIKCLTLNKQNGVLLLVGKQRAILIRVLGHRLLLRNLVFELA
jgi:hypothetical protein